MLIIIHQSIGFDHLLNTNEVLIARNLFDGNGANICVTLEQNRFCMMFDVPQENEGAGEFIIMDGKC